MTLQVTSEPLQGSITGDVTPIVCPRCGRYKMSNVKFVGSTADCCLFCVGCGYYKFLKIPDFLLEEGIAFLVECPSCHKCQTWIRYPLKIFKEDKDIRRLLVWKCDKCGKRHLVSASVVDPTKESGNWYAQVLSQARVVRK